MSPLLVSWKRNPCRQASRQWALIWVCSISPHFPTFETIEHPRLSRKGQKRLQAAPPGQGPQAARQPTTETRRHGAGKSPQTDSPPAQGFLAPGGADEGRIALA